MRLILTEANGRDTKITLGRLAGEEVAIISPKGWNSSAKGNALEQQQKITPRIEQRGSHRFLLFAGYLFIRCGG